MAKAQAGSRAWLGTGVSGGNKRTIYDSGHHRAVVEDNEYEERQRRNEAVVETKTSDVT